MSTSPLKKFASSELRRAARLLEDYSSYTSIWGRLPEDFVESFFQLVNSRGDEDRAKALDLFMYEGIDTLLRNHGQRESTGKTAQKKSTNLPREYALQASEIIERAQKKLKSIVAADEKELLQELEDHGGTQASGIVCIARRGRCRSRQLRIINGREEYVEGQETIRTFYLWFFTSPDAAYSLAIDCILEMITRDRRDPLGRKILCQCQLPDCGAWFFAYRNEGADAKRGLPQRAYCTIEHAQAGNRITKRDWSRKRRQEAGPTKTTKATRAK